MSNNSNINIINELNTYDEVPYESYPYSQSHPSHLRTLGLLFGMEPAKLETARVLELGCAAGGNLIPVATNYPKSQCVGIDLSRIQIDKANEQAQGLELKNITFLNKSITDLDENQEKFDYIVCHGVISWVPEHVRTKILEVTSKLLSKNGIAYISYNTLPGWNMVRSIREMMLYHISNFNSIKDKINQARLLLNFLKDSTESHDTPYAKFLQNEATILSNQADHYLRHDHLEENNHQYYFSDFMALAAQYNLQYLSDASLPSMFLGNLPQKVAEKFAEIKDIVRTEQYMDYLNNRRFRSTLLCHKDITLNRSIPIDSIRNFYLSCTIKLQKESKETVDGENKDDVNLVDIKNNENLTFYVNNNKDSSVSTSSPSLKAVLYTFSKYPTRSLKIEEWAKLAVKQFNDMNADQIQAELLSNAMRLVLGGYMQINSEPDRFNTELPSKPKVSNLVRYQVKNINSLWITNQKHERLGIDILDKFALRYLDGKNTKENLIQHLTDHIKEGELDIIRNDQKITEEEIIKEELTPLVEKLFNRITQSSIIIN